MSSSLCKSILLSRYRYSVTDLAQAMNPIACCSYSLGLRWLSNGPKLQSFTVSYLINSLGFSQKAALSASKKKVLLKSKDQAEKAIVFFSEFGFSKTQISKLFRAFPEALMYDLEKTILPKLDFFVSKGISRTQLAGALSVFPSVLGLSLDRNIKPTYEFFRTFFQSDAKAVEAFRKHPNILTEKSVRSNIAALRDHGVPNSNIAILLRRQPRIFLLDSRKFRKVVEEVAEMGFDASRGKFGAALLALRSMKKSTWEGKVEAYKKWGWSEDDVLEAFGREPRCMMVSVDKISACMNFLENEMGWPPRILVKYPLHVAMSLERRVIPRCLVYHRLTSEGLLKKAVGLNWLLLQREENFFRVFVAPYKDKVPELLELYSEKTIGSSGDKRNVTIQKESNVLTFSNLV